MKTIREQLDDIDKVYPTRGSMPVDVRELYDELNHQFVEQISDDKKNTKRGSTQFHC